MPIIALLLLTVLFTINFTIGIFIIAKKEELIGVPLIILNAIALLSVVLPQIPHS